MAESPTPDPPIPEPTEDSPKQPWSAAEYKRKVAERKANRTPEQQSQDEADAASGLQKAAEQFARGSFDVGRVLQKSQDDMVKNAIEAVHAARIQRKADMEEAFANALKKSEKHPVGSLAVASSPSVADEIQKILDEPDLWDAQQSKVSLDHRFSHLCWHYLAAKRPGLWEVISMIAAVLAPVIVGVLSGTQTGLRNGLLAGLITVLIEIAIGLFLFLFFVPSRIWIDVAGDLRAARNQIAEEKQKVRRIAVAARQHEAAMRQDHEAQCDALKQEIRKANEHNLLLEVDQGPWLNFMAKDTYSHVILVLPSQSEMLPWIKPEIRIRFSNTDVHRTRVENVLIFLVRNAPKEPRYEIELPRRLQTEQGVDIDIDSIFVDARDKTVDYYLKADAVLENEWNGKFDEHSFLRIRMEAVGQRPYCVDLDVDWEQARKNEAPWEPGRVTIRKVDSC